MVFLIFYNHPVEHQNRITPIKKTGKARFLLRRSSYQQSSCLEYAEIDTTKISCKENVHFPFIYHVAYMNKSHFGEIMNKAELVAKTAEGAELTKS